MANCTVPVVYITRDELTLREKRSPCMVMRVSVRMREEASGPQDVVHQLGSESIHPVVFFLAICRERGGRKVVTRRSGG